MIFLIKNRKRRLGIFIDSKITLVSMLRDSECYDPGLFCEESSPAKNVRHLPSLSQIQRRFAYLTNTAKNRQMMEAHILVETHASFLRDKIDLAKCDGN